jgi:hypothetical protein
MIGDTKQVIDQRLTIFLPLTNDKIVHVQPFQRKMHLRILFLLHPFEPFKVNHKYRWTFKYLKLLYSLLMHFTSTAKPCILMRQFLRGHKLSETVINSHFIILKKVKGLSLSCFFWVIFWVFFKSHHVFIEGPAFISVERDLKFKF